MIKQKTQNTNPEEIKRNCFSQLAHTVSSGARTAKITQKKNKPQPALEGPTVL